MLFGVITAWRHLKYLSALWTTPSGYALLLKLALVAAMFSLGAWNWRRTSNVTPIRMDMEVIALRRPDANSY